MQINKPVSTIIIVIITLLVVFLFALPKYQQSVDTQNNLVKKQAEYEGKSMYYARVAELVKSIESRKEALEKIDSALPSNFAFAPLSSFFQQQGVKEGLVITSVAFSQLSRAPESKIRSATLNLELSGSYQGLKNFLAALENSARLFEVNSLSFKFSETPGGLPISGVLANKSKKKSEPPTYDFKLEVMVHTY